jgi:phage gp36-like protein
MAIPKLKEAILTTPQTIVLYFDSPLDTKVSTPMSSFTVNFGQHEVVSLLYTSEVMVSLRVDSELSPWDDAFVSYEPPLDLDLCMRGAIPPDSNDVVKKRNAVRAFYRFDVKNSLAPDEKTTGEQRKSNLGQTIGGQGYPHQNRSGVSSPYTSDPRSATPDDFIVAYGLKEAIQLTNIDDASATSMNVAKMRMAIEDANALIDSYIEQSGKAGRVLITSNRRRTALIIARYYLDNVRRREDVYKDYVEALKQLDAERQMTAIRAGYGDSAIDTKKGILRSWRVPQRYNSVSGKGFSGWRTDMAGDQATDFRQGFGSVGQNNTENNWIDPRNFEDLSGTPQITEPNDGGGYLSTGTDSYTP